MNKPLTFGTKTPKKIGYILKTKRGNFKVVREISFFPGEATSQDNQDHGHFSSGAEWVYEVAPA